MENPTIVVITDRNDLDDQLFGTFAGCSEVLRQSPEQAESREHLSELLRRSSGGVVFTTIQKFMDASALDHEPDLKSPATSGRSFQLRPREREELRVADGDGAAAAASPVDRKALSERRNIIVIADEAHRSQYGLAAKFSDKTLATSIGRRRTRREFR